MIIVFAAVISYINFKKYYSEYISICVYERNFRPITIKNKREIFNRFTSFLKKNNFNLENVNKYRMHLINAGWKPDSICTEMKQLRAFIRYLASKNLCENWADKIILPKVPRKDYQIVSAERAKAIILEGVKPSKYDRQYKYKKIYEDALMFILMTGIRVSELSNLKSDDFDFENMTFKVLSKGGNIDTLPTPRNMQDMLRIRLKKPGIVFPVNPNRLNLTLRRGRERLEIKNKITCHSLRHIFSTELLANGAPITHVSRLLRHSNISITKKYYEHLSVEDLRSVINTRHPLSAQKRTAQEVVAVIEENVRAVKFDRKFKLSSSLEKNSYEVKVEW